MLKQLFKRKYFSRFLLILTISFLSFWSFATEAKETKKEKETKSKTESAKVTKKLKDVSPPPKRGNAPIGKDGHPVELHHKKDGTLAEKTRTDHRLGENYKKNHPDSHAPSKVDRAEFNKQKKEYWSKEYDKGRFDK
jgi:hypothetical protein